MKPMLITNFKKRPFYLILASAICSIIIFILFSSMISSPNFTTNSLIHSSIIFILAFSLFVYSLSLALGKNQFATFLITDQEKQPFRTVTSNPAYFFYPTYFYQETSMSRFNTLLISNGFSESIMDRCCKKISYTNIDSMKLDIRYTSSTFATGHGVQVFFTITLVDGQSIVLDQLICRDDMRKLIDLLKTYHTIIIDAPEHLIDAIYQDSYMISEYLELHK